VNGHRGELVAVNAHAKDRAGPRRIRDGVEDGCPYWVQAPKCVTDVRMSVKRPKADLQCRGGKPAAQRFNAAWDKCPCVNGVSASSSFAM